MVLGTTLPGAIGGSVDGLTALSPVFVWCMTNWVRFAARDRNVVRGAGDRDRCARGSPVGDHLDASAVRHRPALGADRGRAWQATIPAWCASSTPRRSRSIRSTIETIRLANPALGTFLNPSRSAGDGGRRQAHAEPRSRVPKPDSQPARRGRRQQFVAACAVGALRRNRRRSSRNATKSTAGSIFPRPTISRRWC
jgi:hypothetical protein